MEGVKREWESESVSGEEVLGVEEWRGEEKRSEIESSWSE